MKKKKNQKASERMEKRARKTKLKRNKAISRISIIFTGLFICMGAYMVYFLVVVSPNVVTSPYNKRQDTFADRVIRGEILTNDGKVVATTKVDSDGGETRSYPYESLFCHAVGYSTNGKAGVESIANYELLSSHADFIERFWKEVHEEKNVGDQVYTTLDYDIQKAAYDALGSNKGAVVAIEPDTGKILAMVSKPDFDPNKAATNWSTISSSEDGVLLNRVTQGLYPPGSIFKTVTLLEYIREGNSPEDFSFDCTGSVTIDEVTVNCYNKSKHGEEDLKKAYAKSCNGAFATIGTKLNADSFSSLCKGLMFGSELPVAFPYNKSSFVLSKDGTTGDQMLTAIGQGKTEVTPIHMAMLTCAIAHGGELMKPYIVDHIQSYDGISVKKYSSETYGTLISKDESQILTEYMENVVSNGTASALSGRDYTVAGKTGTAEYSSDKKKSHGWFVGFSNVKDPDLVVCVIVEEKGSGSEYAVPVAKKVFDAYYQNGS